MQTGKNICKIRIMTAVLLFSLVFVVSAVCAELKTDAVSPVHGKTGKDLTVTLSGSGFDENTRCFMYLDAVNKSAVLAAMDGCELLGIRGNIAYIMHAESGELRVTDISKPSNLLILATIKTPGGCSAVSGNIIYLAYGSNENGLAGLQIIDISIPSAPYIAGEVEFTAERQPVGLDITGNRAYITYNSSATAKRGLQIIDISSPAEPFLLGFFEPSDYAKDIKVLGNTAYLIINKSLQILDISTPSLPVVLASFQLFSEQFYTSGDLTIIGDTAYARHTGVYKWYGCITLFQIIDIHEPSAPVLMGEMRTSHYNMSEISIIGNRAYGLFLSGSMSYLGVIDLSNPDALSIIGSVRLAYTPKQLNIIENKAYIIGGDGLDIIDVTVPSAPILINFVEISDAETLKVAGKTAYVKDSGGLKVINITHLPEYVCKYSTYIIQDIEVIGNTVYTLCSGTVDWYSLLGNARLQMSDIADPFYPNLVGTLETSVISDFALVGNTAYVLGSGTLDIADVSNHFAPEIIASLDTQTLASRRIVVSENRAYLAAGSNLQIIDVSDRSAPFLVGSLELPDQAEGITVVGDRVYALCGATGRWAGLAAVDVATPSEPFIIGLGDKTEDGTAVVENITYIYDCGLLVADIDTAQSRIIGTIDTWSSGTDIVGNIAYVSVEKLKLLDISDPSHPFIVAEPDVPGYAFQTAVSDDALYVASGDRGLSILPLPLKVTPLAVNDDTSVSFTLPGPRRAGNYTLRVFNGEDSCELPGAVRFSAPAFPGSDLGADFGEKGLYMYDGAAWQGITAWNPENLISWGDFLAADFGENGLYLYDGTSWRGLTAWNPENLISWGNFLAADFGKKGLYLYNGASWQGIAAWNPEKLCSLGVFLATDFGENGLYLYDGFSWREIRESNPENLISWKNHLTADFGDAGIWIYNQISWQKITERNPENMLVWRDRLAADFGEKGLYLYEGALWQGLMAWNPENLISWGDFLAADFGEKGLYLYDGASWHGVTGWNSENLVSWGDFLAADFGERGLWLYDGDSWQGITGWNPENVVSPDL